PPMGISAARPTVISSPGKRPIWSTSSRLPWPEHSGRKPKRCGAASDGVAPFPLKACAPVSHDYARPAMNDPSTIRRLYGRRQGHKLRLGQAALVEELLPRISVPETGPLDARTLFGDDRPLEVEIGFGAGEHLAGQAAARPDSGFIGCEPFLNGVVGALNHVRDGDL